MKKINKIESSDEYIMNGIDYKDLIELYNFRKLKIGEIKEKKRIINKKIIIHSSNGKDYPSLSEWMRDNNLLSPLDKNESKRSPQRESQYQSELKIWNKINRKLKKYGEFEYKGNRIFI